MVEVYNKNLKAIKKRLPDLYERLESIHENNRFSVTINDKKEISIVDTIHDSFVFSENIDIFESYQKHIYLYIYGVADTILIKNLLNRGHHITLFEAELELLFIAFHCQDFTDEILSKKLVVFFLEDIKFANLTTYLNQSNKIYYAKSYKLHVNSQYYLLHYENEIVNINKLMIRAIEFIVTNAGNDIKDALIGLKNHIYNLPYMLRSMPFEKFIKQKHGDTVVMVSTGPSLTKQLKYLRSVEKNVTIICADSALRILYKHDITPDICVSLERIDFVSELFKDLPTSYKQNVIFMRASLQDKSVFKTLESCLDILVMRPYKYNNIFKLNAYGSLCSGTSVANMSHELSVYMQFKQCLIIGQDLAYADDGKTHSKGHILGENDKSVKAQEVPVDLVAYGGEGIVKSNMIWQLFLNALEQTVDASSEVMRTINCTEGGAQIAGTIEMPFKEAISTYINLNSEKIKLHARPTPKEEATQLLNTTNSIISELLSEGKTFQKEIENTFLSVANFYKKLENKNTTEQLNIADDQEIMELLNIIEIIREKMQTNRYFKVFYGEIMQSSIMHNELELSNIKILHVDNPIDNKKKAIMWISGHYSYLFDIAGSINSIRETITNAQNESKKEFKD